MRQLRRHGADHAGSLAPAQSQAKVAPRAQAKVAPRAQAKVAPRVLVLGGSSDGFAVAETFVGAGYEVITSFAGATETRRAPVGLFRVGGFGGVAGLAAYLAVENIEFVVDATHPYAKQIKTHATAAARDVGVPLIHVVRAAWAPEAGDDWRFAPDLATAAKITPVTYGPCFLTVGRTKMAPFASRHDLRFLIRTVDPPSLPFDHPCSLVIHGRGPFTLDDERALFEKHGVGSLVTANSGGEAAAAKLRVAREGGIPVVLVERPPLPEGTVVQTAAEALLAAREMIGD